MRIRFALGAAALVSVCRMASAQVPLANEFQVNTFTTGDQISYGIAMDRQGRFAVVWDSEGEDGNGFSAVGRLFDQTQTPVTGDFQANTFTTGDQVYARVATDSAGRYIVVWTSPNQDGSSRGIYARRFDSDGTPLTGEIPVNTFTPGSQFSPFVAAAPSGSFVVTWSSQNRDGSGFAAVARRFDQAGAPQGSEFVVNSFTTGDQYSDGVAVDGAGNFVVMWTQLGGGVYGMFGRQFDSAGNPVRDQFQIDTTSDYNGYGGIACDRTGNFVVVWHGAPSGTFGNQDILARRFHGPSGAPLGDEFVVNTVTSGLQRYPQVTMDSAGNFTVGWGGQDADGSGMLIRRYDRFGNPVTVETPLNATATGEQHDAMLAANDAGDFIVSWHSAGSDGAGYGVVARRSGLTAYEGAQADVHAPPGAAAVALNGVLEPGESVMFEPAWTNRTGAQIDVAIASAIDFSGPAGADYTADDFQAAYGSIPAGGSANCFDATGNCYTLTVSNPATRPVQHWDAQLQEQLGFLTTKTWPIHIGNSFPDMPQNVFYPFVETLFHNGITGGCFGGGYCPGAEVTRAQMAVFLLKSKYGAGYLPPPALGTVFTDVPASNTFAPWIENLAALGVTGGCGSGMYCPGNPVTRAQMAVFLLKTKNGSSYTPPDGVGVFGDVSPCPGAFCNFIEDLYNQQVTGGCQTSPLLYCPTNPNLRQQMAVFLVKTFGLKLYGP